MHCGLISDWHGEELPYLKTKFKREYKANPSKFDSINIIPMPEKHLDVLFMAGDICEFRHVQIWESLLSQASQIADKIVVVDGNHEHWGKRYQKMPEYVEHLSSKFSNVYFLDNSSVQIGDLLIFGSCLWTDFGSNSFVMQEVSQRYTPYIYDKNVGKIKWQTANGHVCKALPKYIQTLSVRAKREVEKWLANTSDFEGQRLLLTHYPPLPDKVSNYEFDNADEYLEAAFSKVDCNDLSEILSDQEALILAHGHLHNVQSYKSSTGHTVFCNPRGCFSDREEYWNYKILEFDV